MSFVNRSKEHNTFIYIYFIYILLIYILQHLLLNSNLYLYVYICEHVLFIYIFISSIFPMLYEV